MTIPVSLDNLLLSEPLRTNTTLDSADFRGHRLTYLEKVHKKNGAPRVSRAIKYKKQKNQNK